MSICRPSLLKDTLKAFNNFKNKQQKCMKKCFLISKSIHILKVYSIHYRLRYNTNVKKIFFGQNKRNKKCTLFFLLAPTHHSVTFDSQFLQELKHKVHLSKTVRGIFHFWLCLVFIKVYIFIYQKAWTLWL